MRIDLKFDNMIFLGNGERSEREVRRLHRLVDEAISTMGGHQQGPDPEGEIRAEVKSYVLWIMNAFGFDCEWDHLRELPYRPRARPPCLQTCQPVLDSDEIVHHPHCPNKESR